MHPMLRIITPLMMPSPKRFYIAVGCLVFFSFASVVRFSVTRSLASDLVGEINKIQIQQQWRQTNVPWEEFREQQLKLRGIPIVILRSSSKFPHNPFLNISKFAETQTNMLALETHLASQLGVRVFSVQFGMTDDEPVITPSLVYVRNEKAVQELISDFDDVYAVVDVRAIHSSPKNVRDMYPLAVWVHWTSDHFGADHKNNPDFAKYDIITTVSHSEAKLWGQQISGPRIYPIYYPVNFQHLYQAVGNHKRQRFKLVVMSPRTNPDQIRSIMAELLTKDSRFELFVLGPNYPPTKSITDDQLNIRFLGTIPHEEMLAHIATSLAVLHPSDVPETFGSCLLEPVSMGAFVAATDAPASAAREIFECCGVGNWMLPLQFDATAWASLVYGWSQQLLQERKQTNRTMRICEAADENFVFSKWKRMLRLPCAQNDPRCSEKISPVLLA